MRTPARLLAIVMAASALGSAPAAVPFVGCPSDGQIGPQKPPRTGKVPSVPAAVASRLAYYAMKWDVGVLAPRGWHCFGLIGSNGLTVIVAPQRLSWDGVTGRRGLLGPVIQLSQSDGSTSGRFEVAAIAGRIFPAARSFVDRVEAEGFLDTPLPRHPFPTDRLRYHGRYQAFYSTPAHREGLGTKSFLMADSSPIDGVETYYPQDDVGLTSLAVRLSAGDRVLATTIIDEVASRR
jgi:hypothetical protein